MKECLSLTSISLDFGNSEEPESRSVERKNPNVVANSFDFLYAIPILSELNIYCEGQSSCYSVEPIDVGRLYALRSLTTDASFITNLVSATQLRSLYITGLRCKTLDCLKQMSDLTSLYVVKGSIISLCGIENTVLQNLQLLYCRSLQNLSYIEGVSLTLKNLYISHCPKIRNINECMKLSLLEVFEIDGNSSIESLLPLQGLKNLRILLAYTTIDDGDMSICKRMEYSGFYDKKHYNMRNSELSGNK